MCTLCSFLFVHPFHKFTYFFVNFVEVIILFQANCYYYRFFISGLTYAVTHVEYTQVICMQRNIAIHAIDNIHSTRLFECTKVI